MIPLNYILKKYIGGYKRTNSQEKNQPPNVHGRHQTVCQKRTRIGNSKTGSEDIQLGYKDEIWDAEMYHATNEKWKTINDWRKRTRTPPPKKKNQNALRKGILEADTIKQAEMKEKIKKEYPTRTRKLL